MPIVGAGGGGGGGLGNIPRPLNSNSNQGSGVGAAVGGSIGSDAGGAIGGSIPTPIATAPPHPLFNLPPTQSSTPPPARRPMGWSSQSYNGTNDITNPASLSSQYGPAYQQGMDWSMAMNGPALTANGAQRSMLDARLNQFLPASLSLGARGLNEDYASNMARLGLQDSALGLDRADLGSRRSRIGLDMQGRQVDRDYIGEMRGFADRTLANDIAALNQDAATDIRNTNSDYTARGAWFAPFRGIENRETEMSRDRGIDDANIGRGEQESGWNRDMRRLALGDQGSQLDYADLGTAEKRLDLESKRLGMERTDLERILSRGLEELGLSNSLSALDLMAQLEGANGQNAEILNRIVTDAYMYGGLFANDPAAAAALGNIYAQTRNP